MWVFSGKEDQWGDCLCITERFACNRKKKIVILCSSFISQLPSLIYACFLYSTTVKKECCISSNLFSFLLCSNNTVTIHKTQGFSVSSSPPDHINCGFCVHVNTFSYNHTSCLLILLIYFLYSNVITVFLF